MGDKDYKKRIKELERRLEKLDKCNQTLILEYLTMREKVREVERKLDRLLSAIEKAGIKASFSEIIK